MYHVSSAKLRELCITKLLILEEQSHFLSRNIGQFASTNAVHLRTGRRDCIDVTKFYGEGPRLACHRESYMDMKMWNFSLSFQGDISQVSTAYLYYIKHLTNKKKSISFMFHAIHSWS